MKPREYPEVFEWVEEFIPVLETIDEHPWAEQLKTAVQIQEEMAALYEFERILRGYQKKVKPRHRKYSASPILSYFDWILVPQDFSGKIRSIGRKIGINVITWIILLLVVAAVETGDWSNGFVLAVIVCVIVAWIFEYISSFRNSPIYRSFHHLAGTVGAFLGVFIGVLMNRTVRGWLLFGIGGYALGVFSSTVYSFFRSRLRRFL